MKDRINRPELAQVRKLYAKEVSVKQISKLLKITVACIERNLDIANMSKEEKLQKQKNKERAIKAAKTRALKKQTAELAEKAAEAEVSETME